MLHAIDHVFTADTRRIDAERRARQATRDGRIASLIGVPFVEAVVTLQSASEVDHADAASEDAGWEIENALRHAFCALMGAFAVGAPILDQMPPLLTYSVPPFNEDRPRPRKLERLRARIGLLRDTVEHWRRASSAQ
ncbi:MAG: hypothetical protein H6721_20165 [Sandaracinus sp.]|nr:hypothetical protein [Myxococcales bacterium]MCB9600899.1 hypothetical protein [Sandaracinus sp.]MCB9634444.1 hypothetical protein [Sandaracinus sp.]